MTAGNKDWFIKITTGLVIGLFAFQAFISFIYLCVKQIGEGTPVLLWDQFSYYQDAAQFYRNFSQESLQNAVRPVFSLFSVVILRLLALPLNSIILIITNALIYQGIFLASTLWLTKLLQHSWLTGIAIASIVWTTPQFLELSADLWGDIPTAAWVFLYTAVLVFTVSSEFSVVGGFFLGVVAAFGFQIKPIFIFYLVISTGTFYISSFVYAWRKFSELDFVLKVLASCGSALLSFLTVLQFIFPKKLPKLIADLQYNNEVLGYWQGQQGIYNTWLWFINVLGKNFTIPVVVLLLGVTIGSVITTIIKLWQAIAKKDNNISILSGDGYSQLALTFLVCLVYISFFVRSKDIRTVFFLFPLFILLGTICLDKLLFSKRRLFASIVLALVLLHTGFMISWSQPHSVFAFTRKLFFNLAQQAFYTNFGSPRPIDTYEQIGVDRFIAFLENHRDKNRNATVFVPHNSWRYNDALFSSFYHLQNSVYPNSSVPSVGIWFRSAPANLGVAGIDGGIPKAFFSSDYVLTVPEHPYGAFKDPKAQIYNFFTQEALAQHKPEFMDGLTQIYSAKNSFDETIIIYRRDRLPSPTNFVKIVSQYVQADPNNLFNVPFICAALQIAPTATELRSQLQTMAQPEFLASVHYRFSDPKMEAKVRELLQNFPQKSFPEFTYPRFLQE
ncbi:MAG: hypothetical protein RMK91_03865 [Pseudanabaenaceae cyanobacterium SKYGB_i_bin29]|nr:hypothetical protein [Pseudanabaenaceae cyanobacterium SKYG29]MDW8420979.1 hypothetical protein [Pseudanabaenaceae cyanobacterium SKYGB_i_bin29]